MWLPPSNGPEQYKSALLEYPFPAGSVSEEMLVRRAERADGSRRRTFRTARALVGNHLHPEHAARRR